MRETETTLVTLSTGRVLEVGASYEDTRSFLAPRQMSESGRRELRLTDGSAIEVATGAVLSVEASPVTGPTTIGFGQELA